MKNIQILLLYILTVAAGLLLGYFTALEIHLYRSGKEKKNLGLTALAAALTIAGGLATFFVTGGFISYILGVIVGCAPFFQISNKETDAQFAATTRDREQREKRLKEEQEKRRNRQ